MRQLEDVGAVICAAGAGLAPADKKLYALRDVTGTVEAIPLIASSIMSKKIAEGTGALVLDVKVGSGAFMKDVDSARELAQTMVALGTDAGVRTVALLTNMQTPLGLTAGNALEVRESVEVLAGGGPEDVVELTLALAREMLAAAGRTDVDPADALRDGRAMDVWKAMIRAQGGDPDAELPTARETHEVLAPADGVLTELDAYKVGVAAWRLGAGRARKEDPVQAGAGVEMHYKPGGHGAVGGAADDAAHRHPREVRARAGVARGLVHHCARGLASRPAAAGGREGQLSVRTGRCSAAAVTNPVTRSTTASSQRTRRCPRPWVRRRSAPGQAAARASEPAAGVSASCRSWTTSRAGWAGSVSAIRTMSNCPGAGRSGARRGRPCAGRRAARCRATAEPAHHRRHRVRWGDQDVGIGPDAELAGVQGADGTGRVGDDGRRVPEPRDDRGQGLGELDQGGGVRPEAAGGGVAVARGVEGHDALARLDQRLDLGRQLLPPATPAVQEVCRGRAAVAEDPSATVPPLHPTEKGAPPWVRAPRRLGGRHRWPSGTRVARLPPPLPRGRGGRAAPWPGGGPAGPGWQGFGRNWNDRSCFFVSTWLPWWRGDGGQARRVSSRCSNAVWARAAAAGSRISRAAKWCPSMMP